MKPTTVAFGSGNEQPAAFFRAVQSGLVCGALALAAVFSVPGISVADEGGVSFWLPGLFGSLAAVPQAAPGWSLLTFSYYTNVSAGGDVAAAREVEIGRFTPTTDGQTVRGPSRQSGPPMDPTELHLRDPGSRRAGDHGPGGIFGHQTPTWTGR